MNTERNDGYLPQDCRRGGRWVMRFVRVLFGLRCDWSTTGTNGYGLPCEAQCSCGKWSHRILKESKLPEVAEWQDGKYPSANNKNKES